MDLGSIAQAKMSESVHKRFSEFIESEFGIKMPPIKKALLEGRLAKRLRVLKLASFDEYCDYFFAAGFESEMPYFSDLVSTHKTDFFREPSHYDLMRSRILPELTAAGVGIDRPLELWSSASSTGEEPYTLGMVLDDYGRTTGRPYRFSILGSDISEPALAKALHAVYHERLITPISEEFRRRYLLRGSGKQAGYVRIVPALRSAVRFRAINLMDDDYSIGTSMDIIFCRNVLIYFDKTRQGEIISKLATNLRPGGFLFLGHSETILGPHPFLKPVVSTVYRKVVI